MRRYAGRRNGGDMQETKWMSMRFSSGESGEAAIIPRTSFKGTGMEVAVFSFGEASCLYRHVLDRLGSTDLGGMYRPSHLRRSFSQRDPFL
ncbi:hypothetical protein TNCV_1725011 [Trichonephila clavipes]|nr:hypothetical protein TNCV_1725011 [Trichonephila clavipes]